MYVITNRSIDKHASGLKMFGKEPNPLGPNELRLVKVSDRGGFDPRLLEDKLDPTEVAALKQKYGLNIDPADDWYASLRVACELYEEARTKNRHLLFFVHGYNNDMGDVLKAARELQRLYDLIVVPFSWPANGGGAVSGSAAYLSDKDDARSSATALHRAVQKMGFYHALLTEGLQKELLAKAIAKHPHNREKAQALFTELVNRECRFTLNMLCHSMGNYLLKYASQPGNSGLRNLIFDNICLLAADANNPGHERWVEALPTRNRLYIVINEDDYALKWSRRKPGDEQLERLGAHLRNLVARNAYYINVTNNKGVGNEHSYFKGDAVTGNATLRGLFAKMFEGANAEKTLQYRADLNFYHSS